MRISGSTRGLTFSFHENEYFQVGTKYRYILDKKQNEIIILPDENGKLKVSKKGTQNKPLFDIRNKEVKDMIRNDMIEIIKNEYPQYDNILKRNNLNLLINICIQEGYFEVMEDSKKPRYFKKTEKEYLDFEE